MERLLTLYKLYLKLLINHASPEESWFNLSHMTVKMRLFFLIFPAVSAAFGYALAYVASASFFNPRMGWEMSRFKRAMIFGVSW